MQRRTETPGRQPPNEISESGSSRGAYKSLKGVDPMQATNRKTAQIRDRTRGRVLRTFLVITVVTALGAIGFLSAGSVANSANRTNATVSLRQTKLGRILVNSRGHTLYMFAKDRHGKSSCSGSCAKFWPPLLSRAKPTSGPGVKASMLGTTRRSNGSLQVTYNKHPLYTYALDKRAGQTKGEGSSFFGAKWWAVSAGGRAVLKSSGGTTSTTTTGTTTTDPYPGP
jgi:predicted lipoprotein with Yx(FWY)xxD motif